MTDAINDAPTLRTTLDGIVKSREAAATTLGLSLSHSCPVRCAHCAVSCLPHLSEPASKDDLTCWLEQAAATGNYRTVNITGGEPLDHPDTLVHVLRTCLRLGLHSTMVTSAIWATSIADARRVLLPLTGAGVSVIFVSFDEYHLRRVPVTRVAAALQVAHDEGASVGVSMLTGSGLRDPQELLECLRPHLSTQARADLNVLTNTMVFVGRAARLRRKHQRASEPLTSLQCSGVGLVIHENGDVYGCCGPDQPTGSAMHFGNLHKQTFQEIYAAYRSSLLPSMVRLIGLRSLIDRALASGSTELVRWTEAPDSEACNMCQSFTRSQRAVEAVRNDAGLRRLTAERALLLERDPMPLLAEHSKRQESR